MQDNEINPGAQYAWRLWAYLGRSHPGDGVAELGRCVKSPLSVTVDSSLTVATCLEVSADVSGSVSLPGNHKCGAMVLFVRRWREEGGGLVSGSAPGYPSPECTRTVSFR